MASKNRLNLRSKATGSKNHTMPTNSQTSYRRGGTSAKAVQKNVGMPREDSELLFQVLVVAHVPLMRQQQPTVLQQADQPRQLLRWEMGPSVRSLEEVHK